MSVATKGGIAYRYLVRSGLIFIVLLFFMHYGFSQSKKIRRIPDKIILLNGDVETGKVIREDSLGIVLKKQDYSEKSIPWGSIDSIGGLSYYTLFFSPSFGYGNINYFSTFLYDTVHSSGLISQLKFGKMTRNRFAYYFTLAHMPVKPYGVVKLGAGFDCYLMKGYTEKVGLYVGNRVEWNSVASNSFPFFNFDTHCGFEYHTRYFGRLFSELGFQNTVLNVVNGKGFHVNMGIRISREYANYYRKLNAIRPGR